MLVKENLAQALSTVITIWLIDLNTWTANTGQNSLGDQNVNFNTAVRFGIQNEVRWCKRMTDAGELRKK